MSVQPAEYYKPEQLYNAADYNHIPEGFKEHVCRCSGAKSYCNPLNGTPGSYDLTKYTLPFEWWVCSTCLKPSPLNALNARLIRECEGCESAYLITENPDTMNLCPWCLENN